MFSFSFLGLNDGCLAQADSFPQVVWVSGCPVRVHSLSSCIKISACSLVSDPSNLGFTVIPRIVHRFPQASSSCSFPTLLSALSSILLSPMLMALSRARGAAEADQDMFYFILFQCCFHKLLLIKKTSWVLGGPPKSADLRLQTAGFSRKNCS